jgi:hypothetical protein
MPTPPAQQYLQVFSLEELIRAPLVATVQGDFFAARSFVKYIREYGFTNANGDDFGHLRMVTFRYRTEGGWAEVSVPLLSLVPLPLLQVTDADFKYDIRILGALGHDPTKVPRDARKWDRTLGLATDPPGNATVMAAFAPMQPQTASPDQQMPTLVANMSIAIAMRRADLPAGIAAILNVAQSSIAGNPQPRLTVAPSVGTLDASTSSVVYTAKVVDRAGAPQAGQLVTFTFISTVPLRLERAAGTLSDQGPLSMALLTDAAGAAGVRVAASPPQYPRTDAQFTVTADLDQGNGQYGPESARALLQIMPKPEEVR